MTLDEVRDALDRLQADASLAVTRFDHGPQLAGRLAVLPSAFNPPTIAHLALLDVAGDDGARPAALLSTRNVAKEVFGATLEHRVGMLLSLRGDFPGLVVLAVNAARLVDQGRALRAAFPGVEFDFVVGYDTLVRLFDPVYYEDMEGDLGEFFAFHRLVAANRGDAESHHVRQFIETRATRFASAIVLREIHPLTAALSSTAARESVGRGAAVDDSVPPAVADYIARHRLYA